MENGESSTIWNKQIQGDFERQKVEQLLTQERNRPFKMAFFVPETLYSLSHLNLMIILFYIWRNSSSEKLNNLPKDLQLLNIRGGAIRWMGGGPAETQVLRTAC